MSERPSPLIPEFLRNLRDKAGMTQAQLARTSSGMTDSPYNRAFVANFETGRTPLTVKRLHAYLTALGADVGAFFDLVRLESHLEGVTPAPWDEIRDRVISLTDEGRYDAALALSHGALQWARSEGDKVGEAHALLAMAVVCKNQHLLAAGRHFCEEAIATGALDELRFSQALIHLAGFYAHAGLSALVPSLLTGIPRDLLAANPSIRAYRANVLGFHYWKLQDYNAAAEHFLKAARSAPEGTGGTMPAWACASAGASMIYLGRFAEGLSLIKEAEERAEKLGDAGRCFVYLRSGIAELAVQDHERASLMLTRALSLAQRIHHDQWIYESQVHLTRLAIQSGDIRAARGRFGIVKALHRRVRADREDQAYYSEVVAALQEES